MLLEPRSSWISYLASIFFTEINRKHKGWLGAQVLNLEV